MMLKRKLHKAGFITGSFMLIAAVSGSRTINIWGDTILVRQTTSHDSTGHTGHVFDSTGLCTCVPFLDKDELANAPRIQLTKNVTVFVNNYIKENRYFLDKIKIKSVPYFTTIDKVFNQYELPVELKYLAVIESKLNNNIVSNAGATGLWQLMPASARGFGLKVGGKNDERKNTYKSSVAAAKCLIYLHDMFDDWLLTLAAYNSGPARVLSAIKKSGSRNYWVLQNYLPLETRNHIKKFISIHYYFEGHGSLATMTKAETRAHIEAVAAFIKKQEEPKTDSLKTETAETKPVQR